MTALNSLTNDQLRSRLSQLCFHTRKLETEIFTCLQEVESRLIHWELGFSSIYDYAIRELKMSEGETHRRISAMRALSGLPELKAKLQTGELTVTNLAHVQKCIRAQTKESGVQITLEQKRELIAKVESKSSREAEKILVELMPEQAIVKEVIKPISQTQSRVSLVIDDSLMQKLEKLKNLMAHKNPNYSLIELIEELANQALKKWDKLQKQEGQQSAATDKQKTEVSNQQTAKSAQMTNGGHTDRCCDADISPKSTIEVHTAPKRSRHIPAAIKRAVWQRDRGCCGYKNEMTGQVCKSTYKLELDHLQPWAKGGEHRVDNLALRCRGHNTLNAVQSYGKKHMSQWLAGI